MIEKLITRRLHRSNFVQDDLKPYPIILTSFRKTADLSATLPSAGDGTNHALQGHTHGSESPWLKGHTEPGVSTTEKSRVLYALPAEYVAGQTVIIRIHSKLEYAVEVFGTVGLQVYKSDKEKGVSALLCDPAAQPNTTSWADYDFTITPTALVTGDVLDIEITTVINDSGGSQDSSLWMGDVRLLCDVKG